MFEKLMSTTVKEFLIRKVEEQTTFPMDVIEKVISFQGEDIIKSIDKVTQIEISGFGVLFISKKKLQNRIERYTNSVNKGGTPEYKAAMEKEIEYLKIKQCQNLKNT